MTQPFSISEIARARAAPFRVVLDYLDAYVKIDRDYSPRDPSRRSLRILVCYCGRDFSLIITGEKFVNDLLAPTTANRGGGGAIDLVEHLTGLGFVQSVRLCLEAIEAKQSTDI